MEELAQSYLEPPRETRGGSPGWEALASHLGEHGIACEPPETRYGADGYGPSIYVTDPEGNTVELKGEAGEGEGR